MPKDYAKRVLTTSRKPKKKSVRVELIALPILLIMLIAGYWQFRHNSNFVAAEGNLLTKIKEVVHKSGKNNSIQSEKLKVAQAPKEPNVHFDFYNQLPNMKVTLPEEGGKAAPAVPKVTTTTSNQYVISFGQFSTSPDASQLRVSLLLSDCEADIVELHSSNGKLYRVQRGPFASLADAKKLQRELQNKGVMSELKKV